MDHSVKSEITDLQPLTETPPPDALIFKYHVSDRILMWGCAICLLGFIAFAVWLRRRHPEPDSLMPVLSLGSVSGAMFVLCLSQARYLRDRIAVNSSGIWHLAGKGRSSFLAWSEVASIKRNETMRRLILSDASGARVIRVEYQIAEFTALRAFIVSHTPAVTRHPSQATRVFHRSWVNKIFLTVFGLGFFAMTVVSHRKGDTTGVYFTLSLVTLVLLTIARDPVKLTIGAEGLIVHYPLWSRPIPFASISGVSLQNVPTRGNVWEAVVIQRQGKWPIRLFRIREGSLALKDAIESAWRSSEATATPTDAPSPSGERLT